MNQFIIGTMVLVLVSITSMTQTTAQPRFEVPLTVTDGTNGTTLYFGFFPGAHYCFHPADSMGCSECLFLPPIPPGGIFDARLVLPRGILGDSCCSFSGGSPCDYRPSTSATQKDTFRIKSQLGAGTSMVMSWPAGLSAYFTQLTLRFFDQVLGQNVNIDMLSDTTADVTDAGDLATVTIFSGGLVVTSVTQPSPGVPGEFALHQNYPNPFNPSTKIVYRIGSRELVSLRVFDLLGREVVTLAGEEQGSGEHSVEWTPAAVCSGVYIYRLITPGGTITKKMLFIR